MLTSLPSISNNPINSRNCSSSFQFDDGDEDDDVDADVRLLEMSRRLQGEMLKDVVMLSIWWLKRLMTRNVLKLGHRNV